MSRGFDVTRILNGIRSQAQVGLPPGEWPETFKYAGNTWTKDRVTATKSGEVQCVEYTASVDAPTSQDTVKWMVVYAEQAKS